MNLQTIHPDLNVNMIKSFSHARYAISFQMIYMHSQYTVQKILQTLYGILKHIKCIPILDYRM